jgi:hypothetical protein
MIKVCVPYPNHGKILPQVEDALSALEASDLDVDITRVKGSNIIRARNAAINEEKSDLCRQKLPHFDYFLSVDADVLFTVDHVKQLISHKLDIVGGLYPNKNNRQLAVAGYLTAVGSVNYDKLVLSAGHGLKRVGYAGSGFLLISRHALENIEYPWFRYETISYLDSAGDLHQQQTSDDIGFAINAARCGFPIYLDCDCKLEHL